MSIKQTCRISWKEFIISDHELALLEKLAPTIGGKNIPIPPPTLCPEERIRRRCQWKNYFILSKGICGSTGKPIISTFPKDSGFSVYSQPEWWKFEWNPFDSWKDIDLTKSVSEQFYSILQHTPQVALDNDYKELINSDYINGNGQAKDCYLISGSANAERCLYWYFIFDSSDIVNSNYISSSENCSHSNHLSRCYNIHYGFDVNDTRDSRYVFSVQWGAYLLGCVWLVNAKYQILNQACTQQEYEKTLEKLKYDIDFIHDFESKVLDLIKKIGISDSIISGSENCDGDFCYNSRNSTNIYSSAGIENSAWISDSFATKDSMDINQWWENSSLCYEGIAIWENADHIYFSAGVWANTSYCFYSFNCRGSSYLWGCNGLMNQKYCIYNKQYSEEEWETNVLKIIEKMQESGEWGEFFDPQFSLYPYDTSFAMTKYPLSKSEVLERWLKWVDYSDTVEWITRTIPAEKIPDDIRDIPDDILNWAIECQLTKKPYKIQRLELEFYRKQGLQIPRLHPTERIKLLFQWDSREFSFDF